MEGSAAAAGPQDALSAAAAGAEVHRRRLAASDADGDGDGGEGAQATGREDGVGAGGGDCESSGPGDGHADEGSQGNGQRDDGGGEEDGRVRRDGHGDGGGGADVEAQRKPPDGDDDDDEGDHRSEIIDPLAANFYAAKKTVAQGMMDIALITSNANQLRYLLEFGTPNPIYYFNMTLIITSLVLQIVVGTALIFKGRADLRDEPKGRSDKRLNDAILVGVFLITIINVFMAAFAIGASSSPRLDGAPPADLSAAQRSGPPAQQLS